MRCQLEINPAANRLSVYRSIATEVLVLGFADDVLLPPHLGKEVADALPNGRYQEIPDTGHLGFIERPDVVNAAILEFFGGSRYEPLDGPGAHRRRRIDSRRCA